MSDPIPTVVIGGYLGAGKTTLVNALLRSAEGRRIAILVNDFGSIGIDAGLIESRDGAVMNLAGGCVCCSFGSDLVGALLQMPQREPRPEAIVIETSGVALPQAVLRSARLAPGIEAQGILVLADAETVRSRAADRYVGETVTRQLSEADLLVLNKVDLVPGEEVEAVSDWLAAIAPVAPIVRTSRGRIDPDVVLGIRTVRPPASGAASLTNRAHASGQFESASFVLQTPVDVRALAEALADPRRGLLRAKGILRDLDGSLCVVQVTGARAAVAPCAAGTEAGPATGHLVVIGLRERLDPHGLARLLPGFPAYAGRPSQPPPVLY